MSNYPTCKVVSMASRPPPLAESYVESMEVRATRQRVDNKDGKGDKVRISKSEQYVANGIWLFNSAAE